jgi:rubrerythrin
MPRVYRNITVTIPLCTQLTRIEASDINEDPMQFSEEVAAAEQSLKDNLIQVAEDFLRDLKHNSFTDTLSTYHIHIGEADVTYCEDCGYTEVPDNASFCPGCGGELTA